MLCRTIVGLIQNLLGIFSSLEVATGFSLLFGRILCVFTRSLNMPILFLVADTLCDRCAILVHRSWCVSFVVVTGVVAFEAVGVDPGERVVNIRGSGRRVGGDAEGVGAGVGGGVRIVVAVMVVM